MQPLPHYYRVKASACTTGDIELTSGRLKTLRSASPAEFDGPGDQWSPETLFAAALADCFVLTFRGIAKASGLPWDALDCDVIGTLDRIDRLMQFTHFELTARLVIQAAADAGRARAVLDKAERSCLIASSLKASIVLDATVEIGAPQALSQGV